MPTGPKRIENAERRVQALRLRKAGATYQQIADQLGYSDKSTAHRAVKTALGELGREESEELLELELARLDDLTMAFTRQARGGDVRAGEFLLRVQDRRAKYLGLDVVDSRLADAAERQASAAELQASAIFNLMMATLTELGVTPEQRQAAPDIILRQLDKLELEAGTGGEE